MLHSMECNLIVILLCLVMGRSIVIHSKDKGANRIACADIEPAEGAMESMKYNISSPSALTFRYVGLI